MADSTTRVLDQYHAHRFNARGGFPMAKRKTETFYAYQLGPLTAAVAAHGTTNKWEALPVIPLTDSDEVHFAWVTPDDFDYRYPIYLRWGLIANAASKAQALATTIDRLDTGATMAGSDAAGDGATTLTETITTISTATNPGADEPFFSVWGKINGHTSDFDILGVKLVASGQTTADAVRVFCLQISYTPLTA